jgi:hypothetical protein
MLEEMGEVSEVAKSAHLALSDPNDPSSRRVLAGMVAGATLGTLVTLNPVGGIIGGLVGAGAGAGANEVSKEMALGRSVKDSSLAALPAYRRLRSVQEAKEDQGSLPLARPEDVAAAARRRSRRRRSSGGKGHGAGKGGQRRGDGSNGGDGSSSSSSSSGGGGGGGGGDNGEELGASDVLIYSVLASSKRSDSAPRVDASGPGGGGSKSSQAAAAGGRQAQGEDDDGSFVSFISSSITSSMATVSSLSPFGDSGDNKNDNSNGNSNGNGNGNSSLSSPFLNNIVMPGGQGVKTGYNVVNRRHYTYWSSSASGGGVRLSALEPRWAIWTREMLTFVHRYEYNSEAEARAEFERWVYVRVLTDPQHNEVDSRGGWHAVPERPLADIRAAIKANL